VNRCDSTKSGQQDELEDGKTISKSLYYLIKNPGSEGHDLKNRGSRLKALMRDDLLEFYFNT